MYTQPNYRGTSAAPCQSRTRETPVVINSVASSRSPLRGRCPGPVTDARGPTSTYTRPTGPQGRGHYWLREWLSVSPIGLLPVLTILKAPVKMRAPWRKWVFLLFFFQNRGTCKPLWVAGVLAILSWLRFNLVVGLSWEYLFIYFAVYKRIFTPLIRSLNILM